MSRERAGQLIFAGAVALSLIVYGLTAPDGIPWIPFGRIDRGAAWWRYLVGAFRGNAIAVACAFVAFAAGLIGAVVNRYCGWRVAIGATVVWIFAPYVWNRAITADRGICLVSAAIGSIWLVNAIWLIASMKARATRDGKAEGQQNGINGGRRSKWAHFVAWGWFASAWVFALASILSHDYRFGEAASAFAKGVIEEANGRIIVLNGVCDEQVESELDKDGSRRRNDNRLRYVSIREEESDRDAFVTLVRETFPDDTNIWVVARVGVAVFVDVAQKKYPEKFYLMNGESVTLEGWERRWEAFAPYLRSIDPFVKIARRVFAYEGNAVGNRMEIGAVAWEHYRRIYKEIDPGNFSALVNLNELMRRGYEPGGDERKRVQDELRRFFNDADRRTHARDIAKAAGPVRIDYEMISKVQEDTRRRIAEKIAAGEEPEISEELKTLVEWNNDMVTAMNANDFKKAGRIARAILAKREWSSFIPANGVMATIALQEKDYVTAERFFACVVSETNSVPAAVLNDYAHTLMNLNRLDEAERYARCAVRGADSKMWVAKLTLAEVMEKKSDCNGGKDTDDRREERQRLLDDAAKHAPIELRSQIREMQMKAFGQ